MEYWRGLFVREGTVRHYGKDEEFFTAGSVAQYMGYIHQGTLKYVAYGDEGDEHVLGLISPHEFVADFPFSLRGIPAITSVIATTPCEILCVPTKNIAARMNADHRIDLCYGL